MRLCTVSSESNIARVKHTTIIHTQDNSSNGVSSSFGENELQVMCICYAQRPVTQRRRLSYILIIDSPTNFPKVARRRCWKHVMVVQEELRRRERNFGELRFDNAPPRLLRSQIQSLGSKGPSSKIIDVGVLQRETSSVGHVRFDRGVIYRFTDEISQ